MPAKLLRRSTEEGVYCHIFNKGLEGKTIFNDKEDYAVFQNFLNEYLTPPKSTDQIKRMFTVKGRTFTGIPHQPKNYYKEVELSAFRLLPDRFDLVLRQVNKNALERFMRSLSTRYSIYFNKKYKRSGIVFEGPYKSAVLGDKGEIISLTQELHKGGVNSSLPSLARERKTDWAKPQVVSEYFAQGANSNSSNHKVVKREDTSTKQESAPIIHTEETHYKFAPGVAEILATVGVFTVLLSFGIKNVVKANTYSPRIGENPVVLSETTSEVTPESALSEPEVEGVEITVNSPNSPVVNIRSMPDAESEILATAVNGQRFSNAKLENGWYLISIEEGEGYILETLVEEYDQSI